jgi:hypothetical protein
MGFAGRSCVVSNGLEIRHALSVSRPPPPGGGAAFLGIKESWIGLLLPTHLPTYLPIFPSGFLLLGISQWPLHIYL